MGNGFIEVERETRHDHVCGEFGGVQVSVRRGLADLEKLCRIVWVSVVVLESAFEFALKHREFTLGGSAGKDSMREELEPRPWVGGLLKHLGGEGAGGFEKGFVVEQCERLQRCSCAACGPRKLDAARCRKGTWAQSRVARKCRVCGDIGRPLRSVPI